MKEYYLLLGSNLGDRAEYLSKAKSDLCAFQINILSESSIYETAAWGSEHLGESIGAHLNQVLLVQCDFSPHKLLSVIQSIELNHERVRKIKWGSRTLDIDILYHEDQIICSKNLEIPHPQIPHRRFTLVPLVEIAADFIHPVLNITQSTLLIQCNDSLAVQLYSKTK